MNERTRQRRIANALTPFVIGSTMLLTGCMTTLAQASETENEVCRSIGAALPTRSRTDTQATIDQITMLYATFVAACPRHEGLIP